jgi:hypothetical protein
MASAWVVCHAETSRHPHDVPLNATAATIFAALAAAG